MSKASFLEEAENCRRQAIAYAGGPEAPFLLRVARAFEELTSERAGTCVDGGKQNDADDPDAA